MTDLDGDQMDQRPGRDGLRTGQMPHFADGTVVGAEGGQASGDVGNIAVAVRQVRVTDEVGAPAIQGVAEDPFAERGALRHAGAEEIRSPADGNADSAGRGSGQQFPGHRRPDPALDGRRRQRKVLGHRPSLRRAVAVHVLQANQERAVAFGGGQHAPLQRREAFRPSGVRGVEALVDDRRALGRIGGGFGVGRVHRPPVGIGAWSGQSGRAVPGHRADRHTQRGQVRDQGLADLAGPEHYVQLILAHTGPFADLTQRRHRRPIQTMPASTKPVRGVHDRRCLPQHVGRPDADRGQADSGQPDDRRFPLLPLPRRRH
jgi:hypothetical protein